MLTFTLMIYTFKAPPLIHAKNMYSTLGCSFNLSDSHFRHILSYSKPNFTLLLVLLDSRTMMVSLGKAKNYWRASSMRRPLNRQLASLIGSLIAVPHGQLFHRDMEMTKTQALKHQVYNFDKCITPECKTEM